MTVSTERPRGEPGAAARIPDFFIVGHAKCGTTALYEMLRRHPQIYMPDVKEPMFFARNRGEAGSSRLEQTGVLEESLDDYLALFAVADAEQLAGEASTFYLWSPQAARRIAELQPRAKIIAIFREPASFLRSLHLQALQNGAETERDLRRAIALEDERRHGRRIPPRAGWPRALLYTDRVRYVEQLRRYHEAFGRDQVLVLIYDDFKSRNELTVREVLRFLEVDEDVSLEVVRANPTVAVRSVRLDTMTRSLGAGGGPLAAALRGTVRGLSTPRLRRAVLYPMRRRLLYGQPRPADTRFDAELRRRFKGEVEAISAYLDRDLVALWGYDGVD